MRARKLSELPEANLDDSILLFGTDTREGQNCSVSVDALAARILALVDARFSLGAELTQSHEHVGDDKRHLKPGERLIMTTKADLQNQLRPLREAVLRIQEVLQKIERRIGEQEEELKRAERRFGQ